VAGHAAGYGIIGMRERAEIGGGSIRLEQRDGGGTTVALTLPLRGRT
jgi:signal transduction histidine kinase